MSTSRRAVLTGVGLITPIGLDAASFWDNLRKGRSGVHSVQAFDASALPVRFAGEVRGFDARDYIDKKKRKQLNAMARTSRFAVAAAQLALDDAAIDPAQLDPTRFGVIFGVGTISGDLGELGAAARASRPVLDGRGRRQDRSA